MAGHHHHDMDPGAGDARILWAIGVNLPLTVVQIIGGIVSGSLALVADAVHNLSDALSLLIAFVARKISRQPANGKMTFGYGRAEIVAALVNYTTLIVIGVYLVYEAVFRFITPVGVDGWLVVMVAAFALAVDVVTALLTYTLSRRSMNLRAAFLHNVADALGSVAVIVAGTLILLYDWRLLDPLATLLIAGYILWLSIGEMGPVIRLLMLGAPPDLDADKVATAMLDVDGVSDIHHLHLWQMQEHENALEAHVTIAEGQWNRADEIKQAVKHRLDHDFAIAHSTLEIECTAHACVEPELIGHDTGSRDTQRDEEHLHNH